MELFQKCSMCLGTGLFPPEGEVEQFSCKLCSGDGKISLGEIELGNIVQDVEYIKDKIKKICNKLNIPEN